MFGKNSLRKTAWGLPHGLVMGTGTHDFSLADVEASAQM